jgi:large subunit ribosomal protein L17
MRHGKKFNHLSRTHEHRKAMLSNMATSLIMNKRIKTTVAKAKALQKYIDPLLTKSKSDTTQSRRIVFKYLQDKYAVTELFREVSTKISDRPGGYTRIIKLGQRFGDAAEMCYIELVDYNENLLSTKKATTKKATVRRGRKKSTAQTTATQSDSDSSNDEAVKASDEPPQATLDKETETPSPKKESEKKVESKVQNDSEKSAKDTDSTKKSDKSEDNSADESK